MPSAHDSETAAPKDAARRLVIGIPSVARAPILAETVRLIALQTRLPDLVIVSVCDPSDTDGIENAELPFPVEVVVGAPGLTRQRNRVLLQLRRGDLLLFLDDDFLMAPDYLRVMEQVFETHPDVVLATGSLIADGIQGPGLNHAQGVRLIEEDAGRPVDDEIHAAHTGYGCNTALRATPLLDAEMFFDERLPLYGWLEDVDFSNRVCALGRMVRPGAMRGVHLGTKTGRTPGVRLGYSQIANPVYLLRKGTIAKKRAWKMMLRNVQANIFRTLRPVPWSDHNGRLKGNLLAMFDVLTNRCDPKKVVGLGQRKRQATRSARLTASR